MNEGGGGGGREEEAERKAGEEVERWRGGGARNPASVEKMYSCRLLYREGYRVALVTQTTVMMTMWLLTTTSLALVMMMWLLTTTSLTLVMMM